ncbi:MAG: preprotein translocase subunit SecE [Thermodesulfobacteriota bacterium]
MADSKANLPQKAKGKVDKKGEKSGEGFSFSQISVFTAEVKNEFGKIAWPDKKHTMASATVVIVLVSIMALYLGAVDLVIGKLVSYILN